MRSLREVWNLAAGLSKAIRQKSKTFAGHTHESIVVWSAQRALFHTRRLSGAGDYAARFFGGDVSSSMTDSGVIPGSGYREHRPRPSSSGSAMTKNTGMPMTLVANRSTAKVLLGGGDKQLATLEAEGQDPELPRLAACHQCGGLIVEHLDFRLHRSGKTRVLQGPCVLDLPGIDAEESLREQSERLTRALLLSDDGINLPAGQDIAFDQQLAQANFAHP